MVKTTTTFADERTPEQRKAQEAMTRRADASRRVLNDALGFWQVCRKPVCRRRHACSGDMHACFEEKWKAVPDEDKEYWRACIRARVTTNSAEEIHHAGLAAREACLNGMQRAQALSAPQNDRVSNHGPECRRAGT